MKLQIHYSNYIIINFAVMTKLTNYSFKIILCCLAILFTFTGCQRKQKFDTAKWDTGDGLTFPVRDLILDDLLQTHQFKGLKYRQVRHFLRYPQFMDSTKFYYQIIDTHTNTFKPDHIKTLIFYIDKNEVITKVELYDNKANPKSTYY